MLLNNEGWRGTLWLAESALQTPPNRPWFPLTVSGRAGDVAADTGGMDEREPHRPSRDATDPGVEAVRAFRSEDESRSAAKWERIEATWREANREVDEDERDRCRAAMRDLADLQNELGLTD